MSADSTPLFDQMKFDYDVAASAFEEVSKALKGAIDLAKGGTRNVDFAVQELDGLLDARKLVADAVEKVAVARGSAHDAAYDAPSVKLRKAEIVACVKQIAAWEKQLLKLDEAAAKQAEATDRSIDRQIDVDGDYEDALERMWKLARELEVDRLPALRDAMAATFENARKHLARRDAEGLKLDCADADELQLKPLVDGVPKLRKLIDEALRLNRLAGNDVRKAHMADIGHAEGSYGRIVKGLAEVQDRKKAVKAMKVVPLDVAKAVKTLGVPPSLKAALAKALEGDDARRVKALDDLAKKAKLDKSGKDMLAALRDAGVVA